MYDTFKTVPRPANENWRGNGTWRQRQRWRSCSARTAYRTVEYMESVGCSNDEMDATEADIVETVALLASEWRHNQAQYVPTSGMVSVWGFGEGLEPRVPNEAAFARVNQDKRLSG